MLDVLSGSSAKCDLCTPAIAEAKIEFKPHLSPKVVEIERGLTAQERAFIDALFKGPPPIHPTATEIQEMLRQQNKQIREIYGAGGGSCGAGGKATLTIACCSNCNGVGTIDHSVGGMPQPVKVFCPDCKGTGLSNK